jgi:hypothetical protein
MRELIRFAILAGEMLLIGKDMTKGSETKLIRVCAAIMGD